MSSYCVLWWWLDLFYNNSIPPKLTKVINLIILNHDELQIRMLKGKEKIKII